jgi:hypothetical protein
MRIARRELLGLSALAALSVLPSGCLGSGQAHTGTPRPTAKSSTRPKPTHTSKTPRPKPAFFGHPTQGHLYYGASLPYHRSLRAWERSLGATLALNRSYFTFAPFVNTRMVERCRLDLSNDRLPHVSIKPPGVWAEVASGTHDLWLRRLLLGLGRLQGPIFLTIHHEPENDSGGPGMLPADFVAMQERAIELAATEAPNVTVVPVLQHWTFDPVRQGTHPEDWVVPDAAVFGVDIYNPWSPTNGKEWRTFGSLTDEVLPWAGDTPVAIGEYGCRHDPTNPTLAADWLRDAAEYCRDANVVSMSYFNSGLNTQDGSMELQGKSEHTFARLLQARWVTRPT